MRNSNLPVISIPNLSPDELKRKAINFYNDRGTNWKLFGWDEFAKLNHYSEIELSEYKAPEWVPATVKADKQFLDRICINYLHHQSTCECGHMFRAAKALGTELGRKFIDGAFCIEVEIRYPHLILSNGQF